MRRFVITILSVMLVLLSCLPLTLSAESSHDVDTKPLDGKKISIMGDSISTYTGYSDARPITSEGTINRYAEPYYCPVGFESRPGCHNTELLVSDTWWHQAATELGAEILVSNATNSSGLLYASYPSNLEWEQYLKDMLAYKTRPYHMGTAEADPDIIALYIGSADAGKLLVDDFGTLEDINFDTLIVDNGDGTYTYATPSKVIEAYAILLHKISVTYPNAEIYCFTVAPNAGGDLTITNKRIAAFNVFNEMVKEIAGYYGAIVVDIFDEFALDKDGDGNTTQALLDEFKTYFNNDPHPNASGFDVITRRFVDTVLKKSRYIANVESKAGLYEQVSVDVVKAGNVIKQKADDFVTDSGMIVDYDSKFEKLSGLKERFEDAYTSESADKLYKAEGGSKVEKGLKEPTGFINIPLIKGKEANRNNNSIETLVKAGDAKSSLDDGIYDYTEKEILELGNIKITTTELDIKEEDLGLVNNGMKFVGSTTEPTLDNGFQIYEKLDLPTKAEEVPPVKEGFEFVYLGSDKLSQFYACYGYNDESLSLPGQAPFYQDDEYAFWLDVDYQVFYKRGLYVPRIYLPNKVVEGDKFPGRYESIQQFTVSDKNAQIFTTYCADQNTPALPGYSYNLVNLNDSANYSPEDTKMMQAVANHGYWGTESGFGSLEDLKARLKAANIMTDEELAKLNDGMATTATQYAVWTFSNKMDKRTFYNVYHTTNGNGGIKAPNKEDSDLVFKVYYYLVNLEPATFDKKTTRNIIINDKNFIDTISLDVKSKPETHVNNLDAIDTNDAYLADVVFSLKVTPDPAIDDLKLEIMDGLDVIATGRIAGTKLDGEVQLEDNDGFYVFEDIILEEGQENIRFVLKGQQHLEKTPYLMLSEIRDGVPSQNFLCVAEGDRNVNVSLDLSFTLDIKDDVVENRHYWRNETIIEVGKIEGLKIDNKDKPIKNVKFGLFYEGEEDFSKQNALMIAKTDKDGVFIFDKVPYGNYLIKELSCPGQYIMSEEIYDVTIGDNNPTVNMIVVNYRRPPYIPNTSYK